MLRFGTLRTDRAIAVAGSLAFAGMGGMGAGACGSAGGQVIDHAPGSPDSAPPDSGSMVSYQPTAPTGSCHAIIQQHPIEGAAHVPVCSPVTYGTNPPSSGDHYPIWAAYQTYTSPVPLGFLVHDLEHGAIVFTYNCAVHAAADGGQAECDAEVAAAGQMIAGLPSDMECIALGQGIARRSVLTPDPELDVRFAASAWGWTLRADCFDLDVFRAFALTHYNQGGEDICSDGEDPFAQGIASNCGLE